jgi:hypothetical protein
MQAVIIVHDDLVTRGHYPYGVGGMGGLLAREGLYHVLPSGIGIWLLGLVATPNRLITGN